MIDKKQLAEALQKEWSESIRWRGIKRNYTAEDVVRLYGSVDEQFTLAARGASRLWTDLHNEPFVNALGALTGMQALQQAKAGLKAIYLSGWQVAADANMAGEMYPDQSLYPAYSVPKVVEKINNTFRRADQIQWMEGVGDVDYFVPIVADAEAGFGGVLNAFELMKQMIRAGAAGVHFEDQLASVKKCGHLGGKVLVPTREAINRTRPGLEQAISRGLAYAPYADLVWCETGKPDLEYAKKFAEAIHKEFPGKMLSYNCSPSFNWKKNLDDETIANFQKELGAMGYKFQFVTLAGFHSINAGMFRLASGYRERNMSAFVELQEQEFDLQKEGFTAVKHQREVGTSYFDAVTTTIEANSSTTAMKNSTETEQFH